MKWVLLVIGLCLMLSYSVLFMYVVIIAFFTPTYSLTLVFDDFKEMGLEFVMVILSIPFILNFTFYCFNHLIARALGEGRSKMRPGINRVGDDLVFVMPGFIHEFGDPFHHMSMMRTVELDEEEGYIRGMEPSDLSFWVHELLDDCVFYPAQRWLSKWMGDNKIERFFREILGFFWGLNCGFPPRDVALYTVWCFRCCPPLAVFRKRGERWVKTYPESESQKEREEVNANN